MSKLYNEEVKERFLSQYDNEQTQITIRNVFNKTELVESVLDKDIFNFNLSELGKAIENTNPHTRNVAMSTGRFITQYISFAIENGYRESNINPLKGVQNEFYDKLIDRTRKIHYSYEEFLSLLEELQNGQDQAFLAMLFEGAGGERFSELQELTFDDVDWDNKTVFIKQRNTSIVVSDECIKYLDKAYKENTYYQYNKSTNDYSERDLLPSPYIFKNVRSARAKEGTMVGMSVFYTRLNSIKVTYDLEYLTPNAIRQSGMIFYSLLQYQQHGVIAYDQLAEVGKKYNYSTITNNGYSYFNTYLMKEFINETNIKDLYDIDVEIKLR